MKLLTRYKICSKILMCISVLGLSACNNETDSSESQTLKEVKNNLNVLTDSLVWKSLEKCSDTYNQVIDNVIQTEKSIDVFTSNTNHNKDLNIYLKETIKPKLTDLSIESAYLRDRCLAPDYDATGVSIERPDMLNEMLNEWKSTLTLLTKRIDQPPIVRAIQPANRINANITSMTNAGTEFKDCTDSFCQDLIVIPAGTFQMGGNLEEQNREGVPEQPRPWELPEHVVNINTAFAIGKYEVTLDQFNQFQQDTGWEVQGCRNWETRNGDFNMWFSDNLNPNNVGFTQNKNEPVVCVRREDGREFAKWLSAKTGQKYRLPTEAEWEYAARAGTTTTYFWGNGDKNDQACKYANVLDTSTTNSIPQIEAAGWSVFKCNDNYAYTAPVGQFLPNAFGLYDMTANAREWVDDCWHANYENAPTDGKSWGSSNKALCQFPVLRGGSWIYNTFNVRIAYRNAYLSSQARSNMWGFRLVREI